MSRNLRKNKQNREVYFEQSLCYEILYVKESIVGILKLHGESVEKQCMPHYESSHMHHISKFPFCIIAA